MSPERREHLKRLAALILNRPRLVQQRAVETLRLQTAREQRLFLDGASRAMTAGS